MFRIVLLHAEMLCFSSPPGRFLSVSLYTITLLPLGKSQYWRPKHGKNIPLGESNYKQPKQGKAYERKILPGYEFKLKTMAVQILVHQINAHRLRSVFTSVNAALPMSGNYIYLIQEPYLYQGNVCSLDKARLFYSRNLHCRTVIFSNLPLTFHASLSVRDCTTCSVPMNGKNTYFSSVYLDINRTIEEPFWTKTIQKAQTTGSHHYAGIDSNAHSPIWGSPTPNPRGLSLEDFIYAYSLLLLNTGNKPTFETRGGNSIINITLTSPPLANHTLGWQVHDEMHLSDHHLISCAVRLTPEHSLSDVVEN
jgi:hypothetical protein